MSLFLSAFNDKSFCVNARDMNEIYEDIKNEKVLRVRFRIFVFSNTSNLGHNTTHQIFDFS